MLRGIEDKVGATVRRRGHRIDHEQRAPGRIKTLAPGVHQHSRRRELATQHAGEIHLRISEQVKEVHWILDLQQRHTAGPPPGVAVELPELRAERQSGLSVERGEELRRLTCWVDLQLSGLQLVLLLRW